MDIFNKIFAWVKSNILVSVGILVAVIMVLFPKLIFGLFKRKRIRHRRVHITTTRRRRSLPRSVGTHRMKTSTKKKAWQVKGSLAAKRHMAQIRRMR